MMMSKVTKIGCCLVVLVMASGIASAAVYSTTNMLPTGASGFETWATNGYDIGDGWTDGVRWQTRSAATNSPLGVAGVYSGNDALNYCGHESRTQRLSVYREDFDGVAGRFYHAEVQVKWAAGNFAYLRTRVRQVVAPTYDIKPASSIMADMTTLTLGDPNWTKVGVDVFLPSGIAFTEGFRWMLECTTTAGTVEADVYVDEYKIFREAVNPTVATSTYDSVALGAGDRILVTLGNVGGEAAGGYNIAFDPDVTITAPDALIEEVTWVSDTEVTFYCTTTVGEANLTVANVYSDQDFGYTLVPEPATMGLLLVGSVFGLIRRKK